MIARVVVRGTPTRRNSALGKSRTLLLEALRRLNRSETAGLKFLITPGGFVRHEFPSEWSEPTGWNSRPADFAKLIAYAEPILGRVLTRQVCRAAAAKVDVVTLGVDLGEPPEPHAELVAVYDLRSGRVHWTGKSYPTAAQEASLVRAPMLRQHLIRTNGERVLVLGCHDLNMFSGRSWSNQARGGARRRCCRTMRRLAKAFRPTVVLQHAHSTDSPNIWRTAWAGLRAELPTVVVWASGIDYSRPHGRRRGSLPAVLAATAGAGHSIDIVVNAG